MVVVVVVVVRGRATSRWRGRGPQAAERVPYTESSARPEPTRPEDTKSEFSVKFEISGPRAHERCIGARIWGCGATTVCNGVLHTKSWLEIFQTRGDLAPHFRVPHTTAKFPYDFPCKKSPKGRQLRKFAKGRERTGGQGRGGVIRGT